MIQLHLGDCLEVMKQIPDKSVDLVLTDLPYGTTKNKWDCEINLTKMWELALTVSKENAAIVFFAQCPFDKTLGLSKIDLLRYEWIWEKEQGTGHLNSKFAPMKKHENILVFSKKAASFVKDKSNAMSYFPVMQRGEPYKIKQGSSSTNYDMDYQRQVITENKGERFPTSVLKFNRDKEKLHPTQKPVLLLEYLIKTYTIEGETVLDFTMGSGSTGVAAKKLKRNFIGIEKDEKYFQIAKLRIEAHKDLVSEPHPIHTDI